MKKSKLNLKVATSRLLLLLFILVLPDLVSAQIEYVPLIETGLQTGEGFGDFINNLYYLSIGLAALLAVIKIVIAGVKWMLSDIVTDKSQAKNDIRGSLVGLLIIISAVLVLNIINPSLVNINPTITNAVDDSTEPSQAAGGEVDGRKTIQCDDDCENVKRVCESNSSLGTAELKQQNGSEVVVCTSVATD
jgi:hypothetical protein